MSDQIIIQCSILEKKVCERMIFFSKLTLYLAAAVRRRKCQISELEKSYLMMTWQRCKAEIHGGDRFQMLLQSRKVELFLVLRRISYMSRQYTYIYILVVRGMRQPEFVCVYIVVSINDFSWIFCHIFRQSMYCVACTM